MSAPTPLDDLHVVDDGDRGEDPTVVVVHGGLDRSTSFGRTVRHLDDVPVVRYDRRGYGRSQVGAAAPLEVHVDDLLAVAGDRPTVVFGHSVGGVVALMAAEQRPDVVRAVLAYEAPTSWAPWWPRRDGDGEGEGPTDPADAAEAFMRRMVGDRTWERLPERTRADRRAEGPALAADLAGLRRSTPPFDAASVTVPVLVACGAETTWWHRRAAEELAAALPRAELEVVADAGHGIHLTHPTVTADLIRRIRRWAR